MLDGPGSQNGSNSTLDAKAESHFSDDLSRTNDDESSISHKLNTSQNASSQISPGRKSTGSKILADMSHLRAAFTDFSPNMELEQLAQIRTRYKDAAKFLIWPKCPLGRPDMTAGYLTYNPRKHRVFGSIADEAPPKVNLPPGVGHSVGETMSLGGRRGKKLFHSAQAINHLPPQKFNTSAPVTKHSISDENSHRVLAEEEEPEEEEPTLRIYRL